MRRRLIEAAVKAPSGDNCQPWAFRFIGDHSIEISTRAAQAKSFFDYRLRGTLLSMGAVIENLRIQAGSEGFGLSVDYQPQRTSEDHTVTISLCRDKSLRIVPERVRAMHARTVNRRPYLPIWTPDAAIEALLADPIDGVGIQVIRRRSEIMRWARVVYLADRVRYSHPVIHEELFDKIRLTRAEAERERTGLEIDRLGAGPLARPLMTLIKPWARMQALSHFGMAHALAAQSGLSTLASGSLVLLTLKTDERSLWIRAGEQMQRIWIGAQQLGYCTQPVTVGLYLDQRFRRDGMRDFFSRHEPLLYSMRSRIADLLDNDLTGAILFRLGRGWRMTDTAIRLPTEHFVLPVDR